jgi:hypothetical protein
LSCPRTVRSFRARSTASAGGQGLVQGGQGQRQICGAHASWALPAARGPALSRLARWWRPGPNEALVPLRECAARRSPAIRFRPWPGQGGAFFRKLPPNTAPPPRAAILSRQRLGGGIQINQGLQLDCSCPRAVLPGPDASPGPGGRPLQGRRPNHESPPDWAIAVNHGLAALLRKLSRRARLPTPQPRGCALSGFPLAQTARGFQPVHAGISTSMSTTSNSSAPAAPGPLSRCGMARALPMRARKFMPMTTLDGVSSAKSTRSVRRNTRSLPHLLRSRGDVPTSRDKRKGRARQNNALAGTRFSAGCLRPAARSWRQMANPRPVPP